MIWLWLHRPGLLLLACLPSVAWSASCFDMEWKRGRPFDYYAAETRQHTGTYRGGLLHLVENRHFTDEVRQLVRGSSARLPGDILFVLNSIPNHPGALDAYSRYEARYRSSKSFRENRGNLRPSHEAECFFERANQVYPGNPETQLVWALHHYRNDNLARAQSLLESAIALKPGYIEAHYNLGLIHARHGQLEAAKQHARVAYDAGYPLDGLRKRIAEMEQR